MPDPITPEAPPAAEPSRRDALSEAFDALSAEPAPVVEAPAAPVEKPAAAPEAPTDGRARDESGRFAPKATEKPAAAAPASPAAPAAPATPGAPAAPAAATESAPTTPSLAPASWKPAARDTWAKLPPEAQQDVWRREREHSALLESTAEARRTHEAIGRVMQRHGAVLQGTPPDAALEIVGQFTGGLQSPDPAVVARTLAGPLREALRKHGRDAIIAHLNREMDAEPTQAAPQPQAPTQFYDPRMTQYLEHVEQQKQQKVAQDRQAFATTHEFYEIYPEIAQKTEALVAAAASQNVALSRDDAYALSCQGHPEASAALKQKAAVAAATTAQAATARAKAAASSVRSSPAAPTVAAQPGSRREHLEAAWEAASSRR